MRITLCAMAVAGPCGGAHGQQSGAGADQPPAATRSVPPLPVPRVTLEVGDKVPIGPYLTDGRGNTLYIYQADTPREGRSLCKEACARAWPPLTSLGEPAAGARVDARLMGSFDREDGNRQVTYDGWPLYHFAADETPGQLLGQGIEDFGDEWYAIAPDGTIITARPEQADIGTPR